MSDGLDFLGRFDAAHFAALSFACLALSAVVLDKEDMKRHMLDFSFL